MTRNCLNALRKIASLKKSAWNPLQPVADWIYNAPSEDELTEKQYLTVRDVGNYIANKTKSKDLSDSDYYMLGTYMPRDYKNPVLRANTQAYIDSRPWYDIPGQFRAMALQKALDRNKKGKINFGKELFQDRMQSAEKSTPGITRDQVLRTEL